MFHRRTAAKLSAAIVSLALWFQPAPAVCDTGPCYDGPCPANVRWWGYYETRWNRWPGTEPQPAPSPAPSRNPLPPVQAPPANKEYENHPGAPSEFGSPNAPSAGPTTSGELPPTPTPPQQTPSSGRQGSKPEGANPTPRDKPSEKDSGAAFGPDKSNQYGTGANGVSQASAATELRSRPAQWPPENDLRSPTHEMRPAPGGSEHPAAANTPSTLNPERSRERSSDNAVDQAGYFKSSQSRDVLQPTSKPADAYPANAATRSAAPLSSPAASALAPVVQPPGAEAAGPMLIPAGDASLCQKPAICAAHPPQISAGPLTAGYGAQQSAEWAKRVASPPASSETRLPIRPAVAVSLAGPVAVRHDAATAHADTAAVQSGAKQIHRGSHRPITFSPLRDAFPQSRIEDSCDDVSDCCPSAIASPVSRVSLSLLRDAFPRDRSNFPEQATSVAMTSWSPLRDAFPKAAARADIATTGHGAERLHSDASIAAAKSAGTANQPAAVPGRMIDRRLAPASFNQPAAIERVTVPQMAPAANAAGSARDDRRETPQRAPAPVERAAAPPMAAAEKREIQLPSPISVAIASDESSDPRPAPAAPIGVLPR